MVEGHVKVPLCAGPIQRNRIGLAHPHDIQQHVPDGRECKLILLVCAVRIPPHRVPKRAEITLKWHAHEVIPGLACTNTCSGCRSSQPQGLNHFAGGPTWGSCCLAIPGNRCCTRHSCTGGSFPVLARSPRRRDRDPASGSLNTPGIGLSRTCNCPVFPGTPPPHSGGGKDVEEAVPPGTCLPPALDPCGVCLNPSSRARS